MTTSAILISRARVQLCKAAVDSVFKQRKVSGEAMAREAEKWSSGEICRGQVGRKETMVGGTGFCCAHWL